MNCRIKIACFLLAALMLISFLPLTAFADDEKEYLKEVRISTASTEEAAKQWLTDNGYQVLDYNLNSNANADAVYLGYLTTKNPDEAITDIAVMQMDGGYSFSQFEAALSQQQENVNSALRAIEATIREARQKYAAGHENAKGAYQILNYFIEDDSGRLMGDYLLADPIDAADLSKVMLQSNSDFSILLYSMLAWACTDVGENENWMAKLADQDPFGDYDDVTYHDLASNIFDDYETIYDSIVSFEQFFGRDDFDFKNMSDEDLEAFAADVPEEQVTDFGLYIALSVYDYAGKPLVEFFKKHPNEVALEELYPILDAMSEGQRHIVDFVGLNTLIFYAQNDTESAKTYIDTCISDFMAYEVYDAISIYTGVDRSIFTDGGVALTTASLRESASTGDTSWYSKDNIDARLAGVLHVIAGGAVVTAVAVPLYASKHWAGKVAGAVAEKEEAKLFGMFSDLYKKDLEKKTMFKEVIEELQWNYGVTSERELQILAKTTNPELAPHLHEIGERRLIHENYVENQITKNSKLIDKKYDEVFESVMKKAKQIAMVALGISLVAEAIVIGVKLYNHYHRDYTVIPRIIIDNVVTDTESYYLRYYAAVDQDGEYADLNAWRGTRWNALYTTKDEKAGDPILAPSGFTAKIGERGIPTPYSYSVHYFGETGACNLNRYALKTRSPEIYMFFTRDHNVRATASAFSKGTVITFASIGFVGGIAIGSLGVIGAGILKKKGKKQDQTA